MQPIHSDYGIGAPTGHLFQLDGDLDAAHFSVSDSEKKSGRRAMWKTATTLFIGTGMTRENQSVYVPDVVSLYYIFCFLFLSFFFWWAGLVCSHMIFFSFCVLLFFRCRKSFLIGVGKESDMGEKGAQGRSLQDYACRYSTTTFSSFRSTAQRSFSLVIWGVDNIR